MLKNRTFKAEDLREMGLPDDAPEGGEIVSDVTTGKRRWSIDHLLTFRLPDTPAGYAYQVRYAVGATESQDEGPWEYQDEVHAVAVKAESRMVEVWVPVGESDAAG